MLQPCRISYTRSGKTTFMNTKDSQLIESSRLHAVLDSCITVDLLDPSSCRTPIIRHLFSLVVKYRKRFAVPAISLFEVQSWAVKKLEHQNEDKVSEQDGGSDDEDNYQIFNPIAIDFGLYERTAERLLACNLKGADRCHVACAIDLCLPLITADKQILSQQIEGFVALSPEQYVGELHLPQMLLDSLGLSDTIKIIEYD